MAKEPKSVHLRGHGEESATSVGDVVPLILQRKRDQNTKHTQYINLNYTRHHTPGYDTFFLYLLQRKNDQYTKHT